MEICYKGEIYYIYKKESIGSEQEGGETRNNCQQ